MRFVIGVANGAPRGRAEVILGRGSFTESYPLFGYDLEQVAPRVARALGLEAPSRLASLGRLRSDAPAPSVGFRTLNGAVDLPDRTQVIRQVSDAGDDAVQFHLRHLARCSEGLTPPRRRFAEAGT